MNVIITCMSILKDSIGEVPMKRVYGTYYSPIGLIYIVVDEIGVNRIELFQDRWESYINENRELKKDDKLCEEVVRQLDEYFRGDRRYFTVPLSIEGTEFRKKVWQEIQKIPYGKVSSYKEIAEKIGNDKAVRAIGQANKANKIPIIIPCHRVIGKNGNIVGYAGDKITTQELLLNYEKQNKK